MASGRDRDDPLTFPRNPSLIISITLSADHFSLRELSERELSQWRNIIDSDFGFARPDYRSEQLARTVQFYERHVFLCYKNPSVWPARIEAAEFDRLPRILSAVVSARKGSMKKETRLTICEGHDGTETSNGDVLIFPDMMRYRLRYRRRSEESSRTTVSAKRCSPYSKERWESYSGLISSQH